MRHCKKVTHEAQSITHDNRPSLKDVVLFQKTTNGHTIPLTCLPVESISALQMMARIAPLLYALLPLSSTVTALAATKARSRSGGAGFGAQSAEQVLADESVEITRLRAFLQQNKANLEHVQVGQHAGRHGRGLFATKAFTKPGKIICRIPSDCALALSDPAQQGKDVPTIAHNGANFLKLYFKDEVKRQQWAPYLDTLPKQAGSSATPDFMAMEEIDLLEFPSLVKAAKERKQQIAQVAQENGYSTEEVQYATWLVASRSFPLAVADDDEVVQEGDAVLPTIEVDDRGQVLAKASRSYIRLLVPWIDLANHDSNAPNAKITIIDPHKDSAWFALEVVRPIKKGQEIRVAYGSGVDSSAELLLNYGFVPEKNRMDQLLLRHLSQKAKKEADTEDFPLSSWTTTLDEDQKLLAMANEQGEDNLKKILSFRIKLKQSYAMDEDTA